MSRRSPAPRPKRTPEEHAELRRRGEAGDTMAMAELIDRHEELDDLSVEPGDLGARVERDLIALVNTTVSEQAALSRYLMQMRTDLDGEAPSPIERLLVDAIVTCWLDLQYIRSRWTRAMKEGLITDMNVFERLLNGAQRRYAEAHRTLAQVRRLAVPVVQLNMARQQLNVAIGAGAGTVPPGGPAEPLQLTEFAPPHEPSAGAPPS